MSGAAYWLLSMPLSLSEAMTGRMIQWDAAELCCVMYLMLLPYRAWSAGFTTPCCEF